MPPKSFRALLCLLTAFLPLTSPCLPSSTSSASLALKNLQDERSPLGRMAAVFLGKLAPQYFQSTNADASPEFQIAIEQAILQIFQSRSGAGLCGHFRNASDLQVMLGISRETGIALANRCGSSLAGKIQSQRNRSRAVSLPRSWWIVLSEDVPKVGAWSNAMNQSFLFFQTNAFSRASLLTRVAHELAVFLDEKYRTDKLWFHRDAGEEIRFLKRGSDVDACDVLPSMNQHDLSLAMVTGRALDFEISVLKDASETDLEIASNPLDEIQSHWLSGDPSDAKRLDYLLSLVEGIHEMLDAQDPLLTMLEGNSLCAVDFLAAPAISRNEAKRNILATSIVHQDGSTEPLVRYLLRGQLGRKNSQISQGPRPNATGGTRGSGSGSGSGSSISNGKN